MVDNTGLTFNKWVHVITELLSDEAQYASLLAKNVDTTYSHAVKTLVMLERYGMVEKRRSGRTCIYELTPQGMALARALENVTSLLASASRTPSSDD